MWRNVSTWQMLLHNTPYDMIFSLFTMWRHFQLTICHAVNLLHMTICHMEKILHMTDLFSTSTACGACDKYEVCPRGDTITAPSYGSCLRIPDKGGGDSPSASLLSHTYHLKGHHSWAVESVHYLFNWVSCNLSVVGSSEDCRVGGWGKGGWG